MFSWKFHWKLKSERIEDEVETEMEFTQAKISDFVNTFLQFKFFEIYSEFQY